MLLTVSMSGCIEISKQTRSSGNALGGSEVTEHVHLWGNDGPLTKTYDLRVWVFGLDVVNMTGLSRAEMESLSAQYKI